VDGEVKGELGRDLVRLEVEDSVLGLKTLRARFSNWGPIAGGREHGFRYFDGQIVDFGKQLEVSLGPLSESRLVFSGAITAIEGRFEEASEPELVVFAEDALMQFRMARRFKTYADTTDAEIARAIADEHQLEVALDAPGPTYDQVQQWNQSDLAFLRERAALIGAEVWIADDTLHFMARGSRTGTELSLAVGSDIVSLSVRADLAHQRTGVHVCGYDAQARDVIDEEAGVDAVRAETSGGRNGIDVLEGAFGAAVSYRTRDVPETGAEARDWAKAELLRRARAFVSVRGVARGQPDLIVGSRISLLRVGAPFEGEPYYVTRVLHSYDTSEGFRSRFDAERATLSEGG
jgi:uncharacterized protein